jgi:hypothetical protein
MKAHINGITVEGTPQEIMEYQRLLTEQAKMKRADPTVATGPWDFPIPNPFGSGTTKPILWPTDMIICMNMDEKA